MKPTKQSETEDPHVLRLMKRGIWATIQGEGLYAGTPTTFIRVAGCDLRCSWCDTPHSLPDYDPEKGHFLPVLTNKAVEEEVWAVVAQIYDLGLDHLVVTGGEPVLQQVELTRMLRQLGRNTVKTVTVESNCMNAPSDEFYQHIDLASLSPKVAYWHDNKHQIRDTAEAWTWAGENSQLKIVVASEEDIHHALEMCDTLHTPKSYFRWRALQIESSWLRRGWLDQQHRPGLYSLLNRHGIRLVAQMHPVMKVP